MKKLMAILMAALFACTVPAFAATVADGTVSEGETYTATGVDESAVDVSGTAETAITGATIQRRMAMLPARTRRASRA